MNPGRFAFLLLGLLSLPALGQPATRVVTLAPNLAEMVYQAGAGDSLVGVAAYSDFPRQVKDLPNVGDAFRIDFEQLMALKPDLVLGWGGGNPEHVLKRIRDLGFRLEVLTPDRLEDIADHLELIGQWTGHTEQAQRAASDFRLQIDGLRRAYRNAEPVSVFYQISTQPLYTVNARQFIGQMIRLCGGVNIFGDLAELAPVVSPESVVVADPDLILTADEQLPEVIRLWSRWPRMLAVRRGAILGVDARLAARASSRLVQGTLQVCQALDQVRHGPVSH
jgi:iron complex transport system substrate-binding protein